MHPAEHLAQRPIDFIGTKVIRLETEHHTAPIYAALYPPGEVGILVDASYDEVIDDWTIIVETDENGESGWAGSLAAFLECWAFADDN